MRSVNVLLWERRIAAIRAGRDRAEDGPPTEKLATAKEVISHQ